VADKPKQPGLLRRLFIRGAAIAKSMMAPDSSFEQIFQGKDPWLGPGLPLTPKEEPGTAPRQWQFPPGTNIQISPRSTEQISFPQLRALGEYTIVRVIIERVKEAIKAHEWDITADEAGQNVNYAEDISTLKRFFECPDKRHSWDEWLGIVIEEILVTDALSIYVHRTRNGSVWALEPIDGGTIKVLADERGMEPMYPAPRYQQYLFGVPYVNLTEQDLIYRPRNRRVNHFYGFSPVEQTVVTINMGLRREMSQLASFTDGNIPEAFIKMPPEWKLEDIRLYKEWWDGIMSGDAQKRRQMQFVPGGSGGGVEKFKDDEFFGPFNKFDEWLARVFCFSFGMSPMAFVQMQNRAVAQEMGDQEAEYGFQSIKLFVERLLNEVIDDYLGMPHLRFNWVTDKGRLQAKRVERNVKYVETGIMSIDEVREEEGMMPIGIGPGVITGSGFVPLPTTATSPAPAPVSPGSVHMPTNEEAQQIHAEHTHAEHTGASIHAGHGASRPAPPTQREAEAIHARHSGQWVVMPTNEEAQQTHAEHVHAEHMANAAVSALNKCRMEELEKWERFALTELDRLAKGGKPRDAFACAYVDPDEASLIRVDLAKAKTPDAIRHIFGTRRMYPKPLRLKPRSGGAVQFSGDLKSILTRVLTREAERLTGENLV
jgi:hypothetical protein